MATRVSAAESGAFELGGDLLVCRLGFGAMRITGEGIIGPPRDRGEALRVLRRAVELGISLIDTAESYGPHVSEELIAEARPDFLCLDPLAGPEPPRRRGGDGDGDPEAGPILHLDDRRSRRHEAARIDRAPGDYTGERRPDPGIHGSRRGNAGVEQVASVLLEVLGIHLVHIEDVRGQVHASGAGVTGSNVTSYPRRPSLSSGSSTEGCSVATLTRCRPFCRGRSATPRIARLLLSVEPLVKTISLGLAPIAAAIDCRAASTASRACQPKAWLVLAAFP